ncbi:MAG: helix-turn-helix domain-containing protein [Bacteroidota bacterium]
MKQKNTILLPKEQRLLKNLGENIKLARKRRGITTQQLAERAGIGRTTLWHVEKGSGHISIAVFLRVLSVLGLTDDLKKVALDDAFGRKLQDAGLLNKKQHKQ